MLRSLTLSLLALWSAPQAPAEQAPLATDTEVVLLVHHGAQTWSVTRREYEGWMMSYRGEYFVPDYVRLFVLRREAAKLGAEIERGVIAAQVEQEFAARLDGAFGGDRAAWRAELAQSGATESGWRAARGLEIEIELLADALATDDPAALEELLRTMFEERYGPDGKRLEVDWIRLDLVTRSSERETSQGERERLRAEALRQLEERAAGLRRRLDAGEAFESVARESDDRATRDQGGRLPGFLELRQWPRESRAAALALREGELSAPLFARGGLCILRLRRVHLTRFEDVRESLSAELRAAGHGAARKRELIDGIVARTPWELDPSFWSGTSTRPESVVLRIDGEAVSRRTLGTFMLTLRGESESRIYAEQRVLSERAAAAGVSLGEAELVARIQSDIDQKVADLHKGIVERWEQELASEGRTVESYWREERVKTGMDLLAEKLMLAERTVGERELREAWESAHGPGGRRVEARWITRRLPALEEAGGLEREEWERILAAARTRLRQELAAFGAQVRAGADFGDLARQHSDDPETRNLGGRFPGGFKAARFEPQHIAPVLALPVGGLSEPIEIRGRMVLFQIESERRTPFETVRSELERELRGRRPTTAERAGWINLATRDLRLEALEALYR